MALKIEDTSILTEKMSKMSEDFETNDYGRFTLKNKKVIEYYTFPHIYDKKTIGRIWSFRVFKEDGLIENSKNTNFDRMYGISDKILLFDRTKNIIERTKRYGDIFSILYIDIDRFKIINDSLGHEVGDDVLEEVSYRIQSCIRKSDMFTRSGGDKFIVILARLNKINESGIVAEKILEKLKKPFNLEEHEYSLSCSIGISIFPDDGLEPDILLKNAETAMYNVKESGRGSYKYYTPKMNKQALEKLKMETDLRRAIESNEFVTLYQPQVDIETGQVIGVEALIRWEHPTKGVIMPAKFIPIAEESDLIIDIGNWVMKNACEEIKELHDKGKKLRVAVNISGRQFKKDTFIRWVKEVVKDTGIEEKYLEVELTESIAMNDVEQNINIMSELVKMGVSIAIDDFGTGYSSLSYLKRFPIDKLKVDRSFISNITTDSNDETIVKTIIAMSHSLGLRVIAEGVETGDQYEFLTHLCCDEVQGYLFGKPMPIRRLEKLLDDTEYFEMLSLFAGKEIEI